MRPATPLAVENGVGKLAANVRQMPAWERECGELPSPNLSLLDRKVGQGLFVSRFTIFDRRVPQGAEASASDANDRRNAGRTSGGFLFPRWFLLNCRNMQTRNRYAAVVIKPDYHAASMGMNTGMISTGNVVTVAAARDDDKRFKRTGLQMVANVGDHVPVSLNVATFSCKRVALRLRLSFLVDAAQVTTLKSTNDRISRGQ